jgi:hypothetical protein
MWIWECDLHRIGFRRRGDRYWQCERRFGLPPGAYFSLFPHDEHLTGARRSLEIWAFHVTFCLDVDNVHFYYHEHLDSSWEPGGHTSSVEILRHGADPRQLRDQADESAAALATALGGVLLPRP